MPEILKIIFALMTAAFGVLSFLKPEPVAEQTGWELLGPAGKAELRIAFGGFFFGLGIAAIALGSDDAFRMLGLAYLITFAARVLSLAFDGTEDLLHPAFYAFGAFELISGIILFLPQ